MALDEALAKSVMEGNAPPAIRFYSWRAPAVTLGCFQKKLDGINLGFLRSSGLPSVFRPTGGRAILHGEELTYSVSSAYTGVFHKKNLFECYMLISRAIESALRSLGLPVVMKSGREKTGGKSAHCFQSVSYAEISLNGRKLVGSAQKRWTGGFLQQGSIPYRIDAALQRKVFTGFDPDSIACIEECAPEAGKKKALFRQFLAEGFERELQAPLLPEGPAPRELEAARALLPKYAPLRI
ncbi:MAG: hypothetical protein M0Z59_04795 [Nitrospiraceae bacterium]|nr:hypothetical protein [Nitrospiraceae bacterium]